MPRLHWSPRQAFLWEPTRALRSTLLRGICLCLLARVFAPDAGLVAAEVAPIKLAIGPFYAPEAADELQRVSARLPEMLAVELSHKERFQLVEREKVAAVWQELQLSVGGLAASDTVCRLGRILACDWLVSGTLVSSGKGVQVWTKVIDIKTSVVLDLAALPFDPSDVSITISNISAFIAKAGSTRTERQFIALGSFTDLSVSSTREDWAARLPVLIEKHFQGSGVGVVERAAVTPIFEEFQFDQAGLMGNETKRVKVQPAFLVVDGGCKWVRDTEDKVSVALRIQRMGEKEKIVEFTKPPGVELENAVISAIQQAFVSVKNPASNPLGANEASYHADRGTEGATRNAPMTPSRFPVGASSTHATERNNSGGIAAGPADPESRRKWEDNRRTTLESFQKAILLNPNNLRAKYMLGSGLLSDSDAAQRERGKSLLRELILCTDEEIRKQASFCLSNEALYRPKEFIPAQQQVASVAPRPKPVPMVRNATEPAGGAPTNALLQLPSARFYTQGLFHNVTACAPEGRGTLLIACGTDLYRLNLDTELQEKVQLPETVNQPIRTIACDSNSIWLGTEGSGLVEVSRHGLPPRFFGEKEGLIMSSITASLLRDQKLWLGFGFRESGGLEYLDIASRQVIGLTKGVGLFKPAAEQDAGPPDSAVKTITSHGGKVLWIASLSRLHRFDIPTQKWNLALPFGPRGLSLNSNFVAVGCSTGGVLVCRQPAGQWKKIDLGLKDDLVDALRADAYHPHLLWVATYGRLTLVDMEAGKPIAAYDLMHTAFRRISLILAGRDGVNFFETDFYLAGNDTFQLCWIEKPAYCRNPATIAAATDAEKPPMAPMPLFTQQPALSR